jgi:hypothetical protein
MLPVVSLVILATAGGARPAAGAHGSSVASGASVAGRSERGVESAVVRLINSERDSRGREALALSKRLRAIAERRARIAQQRGQPYPGYGVIVDIHKAHICTRAAREYEFQVSATSPTDVRDQMAHNFASIPSYRSDLLGRRWRSVAVGIVINGESTFFGEATFLMVDLIEPC